ncbi:MAG: hypothetical protein FOGNACKC_02992 [Anaerolineae bacterium]|nr:hypothetical protein [Anaerolineae bacterium]
MISASATRIMNRDGRSTVDGRKIVLEISEHDASRLLALVRQEIERAENAWQSYWQRMASNIEESVEHSATDPLKEDYRQGGKLYPDSKSNSVPTNGEC